MTLPRHLQVSDYGPEKSKSSDWLNEKWDLTLITLGEVHIGKGARACATVPAIISPQSKVAEIMPSDKRHFEIDGRVALDGGDDPSSEVIPDDASFLEITVISTMRKLDAPPAQSR